MCVALLCCFLLLFYVKLVFIINIPVGSLCNNCFHGIGHVFNCCGSMWWQYYWWGNLIPTADKAGSNGGEWIVMHSLSLLPFVPPSWAESPPPPLVFCLVDTSSSLDSPLHPALSFYTSNLSTLSRSKSPLSPHSLIHNDQTHPSPFTSKV